MEITAKQLRRIAPYLPRQRGNVRIDNLKVVNAILYVAQQGCKWRSLPKRFGAWHTVYTRMNRWSKAGVLDRVFAQLQQQQLVRIKLEAVGRAGNVVKVGPYRKGALKNGNPKAAAAGPGADRASGFIWLPRMLGAAAVVHSAAARRAPHALAAASSPPLNL